jgi:hypothetical protein
MSRMHAMLHLIEPAVSPYIGKVDIDDSGCFKPLTIWSK